MEKTHHKKLRKNHRRLKGTIRAYHITGSLKEKGVLTDDDVDRINDEATDEQRTERLLFILAKKDESYEAFIQSLKEVQEHGTCPYEEIVQVLEQGTDEDKKWIHVRSKIKERIAKRLDPDKACAYLVKSHILTEEVADIIQEEKEPFERAMSLLSVLPTIEGKGTFLALCRVLRDQGLETIVSYLNSASASDTLKPMTNSEAVVRRKVRVTSEPVEPESISPVPTKQPHSSATVMTTTHTCRCQSVQQQTGLTSENFPYPSASADMRSLEMIAFSMSEQRSRTVGAAYTSMPLSKTHFANILEHVNKATQSVGSVEKFLRELYQSKKIVPELEIAKIKLYWTKFSELHEEHKVLKGKTETTLKSILRSTTEAEANHVSSTNTASCKDGTIASPNLETTTNRGIPDGQLSPRPSTAEIQVSTGGQLQDEVKSGKDASTSSVETGSESFKSATASLPTPSTSNLQNEVKNKHLILAEGPESKSDRKNPESEQSSLLGAGCRERDVGADSTDADKGISSKGEEQVSGQEESLHISSTEQPPSLTDQEDDFSSSKGTGGNGPVQTEEERLLHNDTKVTMLTRVEIETDHPPAEEKEVVSQEDTTEAATTEQQLLIKKEEEEEVVVPKQVKKSYAEVLKAGHAPCSPAKQQTKASHLKEEIKAAGNSSAKVKKVKKRKEPPCDGEGWQVVQERRSNKAKSPARSEKGQTKRKFDIKDYNRFSILIGSREDLSAIDDDTVSDTEEPGRKELGASSCATTMTSRQKKRKTRKSVGRKKKIIREDRQKKSRRKPSSNVSTIDTGGTLSRQGPASRWIKDEMEIEESARHSPTKAGLKQKKKNFKAKQQQSLQLSPSPTISPSAPRSFHPPLHPKPNQPKGRYRSKDVGPTDRKRKKSRDKRGKPGSGNISRLEEQQVRARRRLKTPKGRYRSKDVGPTDRKKKKSQDKRGKPEMQKEQQKVRARRRPNSPSLPRSTQGRESRSRKRAKVDVHHRIRERKEGTGMRNNRNKRGQELRQLRKTEPEQAVRPKQRLPNRLNDQGRLNKLHVKAREQNYQSTKSKKIAVVRPFRYLNNERASHRHRNIRCPDYRTINIIHNPLSSHSPNIPRSLSQDGLYNNMRGRSDHQEEFWRSGLSAVESARHWALPGEYTENRMRRMDRVLTQLLSGLPDQNIISLTRDTTEPNESPDVTQHIQQQDAAEDSTIYTSEDEDVQSRILPRLEERTLRDSDTSRNDPNGSSNPNNGNHFQRPGVSARDDSNSQGNVPVTSSPWRGGSRLSHPSGRPPDAASQRNTPAPIRSGHRCGRPPNQTQQGEGRSSQQQRALRIARTNSCQELRRRPGRRDQSEERIVSCGGARPVCRVKPIQREDGRSEEESRRRERQ